ncbi:hypothetical protein Pfo_005339 [Paulownia fortunei]|nr:hypothetical protein Pfo_005339 [Paulownia fortunei]
MESTEEFTIELQGPQRCNLLVGEVDTSVIFEENFTGRGEEERTRSGRGGGIGVSGQQRHKLVEDKAGKSTSTKKRKKVGTKERGLCERGLGF